MSSTVIHQLSSPTSWRILSLLRLGERRIQALKRALRMTESAFSHAASKLEDLGLVGIRKAGRDKYARLSEKGRIVFSSLQAVCYTVSGNDGTSVEDDSALVSVLRDTGGRASHE